MRKWVAICLSLMSLTILSFWGCAGHKRGFYSWPYIDGSDIELPSPSSIYEINRSKILTFDDCRIYVSLENEIQTSHVSYVLVIPIPENLKDEPKYDPSTPNFYIKLAINPDVTGCFLEPDKLSLIVDGYKYDVKEIRSTVEKKDLTTFWYFDYDTKQVKNMPLSHAKTIRLIKNEWNNFAVFFNRSAPSLDLEIRLDLSKAISFPGGDSLPIIRFRKVRYGKWYG